MCKSGIGSIAIIGASQDRQSYSNKAVRAYISKGWRVYPVNPKYGSVEGLGCYKTADELPRVDIAALYVQPEVAVSVLPEVAKKVRLFVYVNPGVESTELAEKAKELGVELRLECAIRALDLDPARI